MTDDRLNQIEETAAHLTRVVDDLSDIVARQESEIASLTRQVRMLMEREAARESEGSGGVIVGDEKPPHY